MPRIRARMTVGGLMMLVAVAAIVASLFRPMSKQEAARRAIEIVHADQGPYRLNDDPMAPTIWRVVGEAVPEGRGFAVRLEPVGESPDGYHFEATIWIDAKTREPYRSRYRRENPVNRALRLARPGPSQDPNHGTP